jgi:hypothetical protein
MRPFPAAQRDPRSMSVFHSATHRLIDYWRSRSSDGAAPARTSISPAHFSELLPQVFILGRAFSGVYPLRLAGGFVGDLHGRDLRRLNGLALWAERDRARLQSALEEARRGPEPIVALAEAVAETGSVGLEVLFAPLAGPHGEIDRFLGLYQPLGFTARLQGRPALSLSLRALHRTGAANEFVPRLRLATLDGRHVA